MSLPPAYSPSDKDAMSDGDTRHLAPSMGYKLYGTNSERSLSFIRSWKFLIVMVFSLFYQLPQMILTEFMAVLLGL